MILLYSLTSSAQPCFSPPFLSQVLITNEHLALQIPSKHLLLQNSICDKYVLFISYYSAAKSLQSCPTLCNPIDGSLPGSPIPGILQARTLEWGAISFPNAWKWKVKVKLCPTSRPHGLQPTRLLHPWDFPGKSTGVGCHCLLYMTNTDSIFKSRDITLPTKVRLVKAMVFPVVMYGCESWTVRKVECWRIDAFELWCRRRLLRVPWTARRSNQSILKEISPEHSVKRLMLKLKHQ